MCNAHAVSDLDPKADLRRSLQSAREALVWKLQGVSEHEVRRPMTPTATNLLGLVKHVASVEAGYLGETFGRPFPEPLPWFDEGAEPNADMWATPGESAEQETGRHAGHADVIRELLDGAVGLSEGNDNMPPADLAWWQDYRARVEQAAQAVRAT